jgi:hypothetical protein
MKEIRRARQLRLPRRRYQLTKPMTSDDDESDLEHQTSVVQSNKNTNRMPTTLFDTIPTLPIEEKQHRILHSSSDQSSLFLYSIGSMKKTTGISDDLTPLTITTTNTTPLTALTYSNSKQTEITSTVKIDLTQLSGTDTIDSQSSMLYLSPDRKMSFPNMKDFPQIYDTDTSMKSVVFSKKNSLEQEVSYQKHASCFTISGTDNTMIERVSLPSTIKPNVNSCQRSPVRWCPSRWNLQHLTSRFTLLIGCSSLGFIAGIIVLVIIL